MDPIVPHFTPAKRAGDFIFVSGQLAFRSPGVIAGNTVAAQLRQCMLNIEAALATQGAGLADIVKNMVWLTRIEDFPRRKGKNR